jgi:predicted transcriptional regulator YdeE
VKRAAIEVRSLTALPAVDHTVKYVYGAWLAQSAKRHSGGPDLEIYGPEYHPTSEHSVIHYAILGCP